MAKDDPILTIMRFIPKHETIQKYGVVLPDTLTNQAIKESDTYKTYYDLATGKVILKPKYVRRSTREKTDQAPKDSLGKRLKATAKVAKSRKNKIHAQGLGTLSKIALSEAIQMKVVTKWSKIDYHVSYPSGSGAHEGTSVTPGVLDVPTYGSKDEQISWKFGNDENDDEVSENADNEDDDDHDDDNANKEDDDGQNDDNEHTESNNDGDDFVHPMLSSFDDEERYEEKLDEKEEGDNVEEEKLDEEKINEEEEVNELYNDVNINPKGKDTEMIDALLANSSSVSSGFNSKILNPNPDIVTLRIYSPYDLQIIMANPLPNHGVNLLDDEQVQPEPEDPEIEEEEKEEEEEEIDIEDEMDDPEIINPYEIKEGELPPLNADSDTSFDSEREVEAEDEDKAEATTVDTNTRASYSVQPFLGTTYVGNGSSRKVFAPGPIGKDVNILHRKVKSLARQMFERANAEYSTLKRLGEMDRYLGGINMERRSETREHHKLKQSVSTLEDQMRGLMLEDKEEKERLKKKLRASQQEKEQIEQAFRHVIDWIHKKFRVEIPPRMGDVSRIDAIGCNDLCHFVKQCNYVLTLIMPPKAMSQVSIERLITQRVNAALEAERASRANKGGKGSNANETGGQDRAPPVRECTFSSFMNCNPTPFHVATLGLNVAIGKSWGDMKKMMLEEFCSDEEVQRMEDELRSLKLRDINIAAYTQRFYELVLLCPEAVPTEKKKVEAYIKGLPKNIKGVDTRETKPLCNNCKRHHTRNCVTTCYNCERPSHYTKDCKKKVNTQSTLVCHGCGERGHIQNYFMNKNNHQGEKARGQAYVIKEADKDQGPNVVIEQDAIIVYGKKVVHVPYKNKTLVVEGDRGASQLKVISCIKDRKFIKRGSQLFVAHVTKKEPQEKRMEDVPVIRDFPEVFPDNLPGLPPPRQVEFQIDLVLGAAPVACAPYRLTT
uniref:Reverse transcriptase domain-containing protein n=1 Tax=Tanacetum cinerariifolium TaxID=118510 RepID=A0A699HGN2_TANCI|nr:reverse transcriptase domain-containing protein [Tanacetum cinerariifolium]